MTNDNGTGAAKSNSSSTAVAIRPEAATAMMEATGFSVPQIHVVKKALFKDEGDEADLWLFLTTAKRLGADPFAKQIHAVFRWDSKASKKVMAIQIGIDQLRLTAARTGVFGGRLGPLWKAKGGEWTDLWEEDADPYACKVGGWKIGAPENPTWAVVKWDEFAQTDRDGKVMGQWRTMGAHMLAKCAEAQMLRILFPVETRDLQISEEVPDANERNQVHADQMERYNTAMPGGPRPASKRFHTVSEPDGEIIEAESQLIEDGAGASDPVSEAEIEANGTATPEHIQQALIAVREKFFSGPELPWNDDAKKRANSLKGASDQLRLHEYSPDQMTALYWVLHFASTGEALEPNDVTSKCSARCFVAVQALSTPELNALREAADWWLAQKKAA